MREPDCLVPNISIIGTNGMLEFEGILLILKSICLPVNRLKIRDLERLLQETEEAELQLPFADLCLM